MGRKSCGTENLNYRIHSPTVFGGGFSSNLRVFKSGGRGVLDGEELTRIGVIFDIGVGLDEKRMADNESAAPAGHIEGLAGGVKF